MAEFRPLMSSPIAPSTATGKVIDKSGSTCADDEQDPESPMKELCTIYVTKKKKMYQLWYECRKCAVNVCETCSEKCHKDHDLSVANYDAVYCQCQDRTEVACEATITEEQGENAELDAIKKHMKDAGHVSKNSLLEKCTYSIQKCGLETETYIVQYWYRCRTCFHSKHMGACSACANTCHKNHDLLPMPKYGLFYCDCGAKEDGSCKIMLNCNNKNEEKLVHTYYNIWSKVSHANDVQVAVKRVKEGYRCAQGTKTGMLSECCRCARNQRECTHEKAHVTTYGEIQFSGFDDTHKNKPYVGVDVRISPISLSPLFDVWHIDDPKLIFSVICEENHSNNINEQLMETIQQQLVQFAVQKDSWIITEGTNAGAMKYLGDAIEAHNNICDRYDQVVAIGVASWELVDSREDLIGKNGAGLFPARYPASSPDSCWPGCYPLDHRNTHFLLVDQCTEKEEYLKKFVCMEQSYRNWTRVPVILFVLNGDADTLRKVADVVAAKKAVIVVKGTGGAADAIAKLLHKETECSKPCEDYSSTSADDCIASQVEDQEIKSQRDEVSSFDVTAVSFHTIGEVEAALANYRDVLKKAGEDGLISVWNPESKSTLSGYRYNLDTVSNEALKRASLLDPRIFPHIAEDRYRWYFYQSYDKLNEQENKTWRQDFDQLCLIYWETGMSEQLDMRIITSRFCGRYLEALYLKILVASPAEGTLDYLLGVLLLEQEPTLKELHLNDYNSKTIALQTNILKLVSKLITHLIPDYQKQACEEGDQKVLLSDLLIWAALCNKKDMIIQFWEQEREFGIGGSLLVSVVMKALAKEADKRGYEELCKHLNAAPNTG